MDQFPTGELAQNDTTAADTQLVADLPSSTEPRIFGLIIGINKYKCYPLRGCIADSNNISNFLRDAFQVFSTHARILCLADPIDVSGFLRTASGVEQKSIVILQDEAATRVNIIDVFKAHLINNSNIKKGDTIVFYFAGHGSRQKVPHRWSEEDWVAEDGMIETLCPYDYAPGDIVDAVPGIPDRSFVALLERLANDKGNNITVILDSCHSGGMGRAAEAGDIRSIPDVYSPLPDNIDEGILSWALGEGRAGNVVPFPGSIYKAEESYVLLAACRPHQFAYERASGGVFTTALVGALRRHGSVLPTYSSLIKSLSLSTNQEPLSLGDNQDKQFFRATGTALAKPDGFDVIQENGQYYILAGELAGVVAGTEFIIFSPPHRIPVTATVSIEQTRCIFQPRPLIPDAKVYKGLHVTEDNERTALQVTEEDGISYINAGSDDGIVDGEAFTVRSGTSIIPVIAISTNNNRCAIEHMPFSMLELPQHLTAVVSNWNRPNLKVRFSETAGTSLVSGSLFTVVKSNEDLLVEGNGLLTSRHPLITKYANQPLSINPKDLELTINAISYFTFYLDHRNASRDPPQNPLGNDVTVKLQKLELVAGRSGDSQAFYKPAEDIALQTVPDGSAEFVITDTNSFYGLAIENHLEYNLFVYAFYFNPSDYSINQWYMPSDRPIGSLPPGSHNKPSKMTIGYGSSTNGIEFSVPGNRDRDSGFLKVFVSTEYGNMNILLQKPPFANNRGAKLVSLMQHASYWNTWTYVLTVTSVA